MIQAFRALHIPPDPEEGSRILLSAPHMSGKESVYINEAFKSNWIAPLGPNVTAFEEEVAAYVGTRGGSAVCSGTAAIHLALQLLGIGPGDTVFCSSLTFVASANPICYTGAEPVFIDSEEDSWNLDPEALRTALNDAAAQGKLPKAVIVVHLYGQVARMDELVALCEEYEVPVIEDSAESLGSLYKGRKSGSLGTFGIFSFNGNKIITTSGGGMLMANDLKALERSRFYATQAKEKAPYYEHHEVGYNYRMSNILAGIGRAQLKVIEDRVEARRAVFDRYEQELGGIPGVSFQTEIDGTLSNRWLTAIQLDPAQIRVSPGELMDEMNSLNIEVRRVWKPLHTQKLFADAKFYTESGGIPVSEKLFNRGLCLPSSSNLTEAQQDKVIAALAERLA